MPRLVEDWKSAWTWLSVQIAVLLAILTTVQTQYPQVLEALPQGWQSVFAVAIILGRLIDQKGKGE